MSGYFKDKAVLVTGGVGSIGSEIVRAVLRQEPKVVRIFSNGEAGLLHMNQELRDYSNIRYLLGDVRDKERLKMAMENIDIVFHAAAMKHVSLCEYNPFEAVKTNVIGTQNVIETAYDQKVGTVVNISTDKAVNPISTLGTTKLLAERLITATYYYRGNKNTIFTSVRFGNVLDSAGSVVPIFKEQIKKGGPVSVTHKDMTRFVMTISRAVELALKASEMAKGGEIFILKMPTLRIMDLAQVMIEELAPKYGYKPDEIKIEIIGQGLGEKLDEELITEQESLRLKETQEMYILQPDLLTQKPVDEVPTPKKKHESMVPKLLTKAEIVSLISGAVN